MEKKIKVAILDSGIEIEHNALKDVNIIQYFYMDGWRVGNINPIYGHGTAVAHSLRKVESRVDILSFNILNDENGEAEPEVLIEALKYIYANNKELNCKVINISAGVRKHFEQLELICNKLYESGVSIVAAFCNMGAVSYPAAYSSVIGVDSTKRLNSFREHIYVENSLVNIGVLAAPQRLAWIGGKYVIVRGNSFVAPIISAKICKNLLGDNCEIHEYLKENAHEVISFNEEIKEYAAELFDIQKAAIFPVNKETNSLIRYAHLLPFEIKKVYDSKFSGRVNSKVSNNREDHCYLIENIDNATYTEIDTFIIGHVDALTDSTQIDYKQRIVDECLKKNINVVTFDYEYINKLSKEVKSKIYVPAIRKSRTSTNKFGKLYEVFSPVLAVIGTSSQQGKFSLQLRLRELFLKNGYKIGQLSSEPQGELFGMNYSYPYGYNGTIDLYGHQCVEYVNSIIHQLDVEEHDIILAGAQSGLATLSFDNLSTYNLYSSDFMLGVNPDAVILCVNFHDSLDMISRSVKFAESLNACQVVAIGIFPLGYEDEWSAMRNTKHMISEKDLEKFREDIFMSTGTPSFILGNEREEEKLYQKCIEFFTAEIEE